MVASVFGLSACGEFLNGRKSEEEVIELSDSRFACLNTLPEQLKDFAEGTADPQALREQVGCLQAAFEFFGERTKGSLPDAYQEQDLRRFFSKYFLKKNQISESLSLNLMGLKKALFGGSDRVLHKAELKRMITALGVLKDEVALLAPHMKTLLVARQAGQVPEPEIKAATAQLEKSLLKFLSLVDLTTSEYSFEQAQALLLGMADFIQGEGGEIQSFQQIREWWPVAEAVKNLLFGENAQMSGERDWTQAVGSVVDLYELALSYFYLIRENDFNTAEKWTAATSAGDQLLRLLENSHQMRRWSRIPFTQINTLIDAILDKKVVHIPVSAEAIKDVYQKIILTMLDPVRRGRIEGADALERAHLVSLRREFDIFRTQQVFIDSLGMKEGEALTALEILNRAKGFDPLKAFPHFATTHEAELRRAAWKKFVEMLGARNPVVFSSQGRMKISPEDSERRQSWLSLTRFNVMFLMTRGFMAGYSETADPVAGGVSEAGLIKWYGDFTMFGIEIKAFDPRSGNSGDRSFKEASFFTYSGNGDDKIRFDEMFEFISVLFAGGLGNVSDLRSVMEEAGCAVEQLDVFGLRMFREGCFRDQLRKNFAKLFDNLPLMAREVQKMDDKAWTTFYSNLMAAARTSPAGGGLVETADIRTGTMVLHYAESLFVVYDRDRSGGLSEAEVKAAAPRFLSFLRPLSPIKNDKFVTEAFVVLVYTGQKPGAMDLAGFQGDRLWDRLGFRPLGEVPRSQILQVFRSLKDEVGSDKPQK